MTRNNSETKSEQITELFDLFDQNLTDDELTIKLRSKIEELRGFNINEQKEGEEEGQGQSARNRRGGNQGRRRR